jgi:hypothetical protein
MAKQAFQKKYHFIYMTKRFDGAFYVGMHSTDNLDDKYMGSGQRLWHSIKYHGKDKHKTEILEFLPSREALIEREKEIVCEWLIKDPQCLNLAKGGQGCTHNENTPEAISKRMKVVWADLDKRKAMGEKVAEWWTTERCEVQSELKKKQHKDPQVITNISEGTRKALAKPAVKANMASAKEKNWQDPEYRKNQIEKQNIGKQTDSFSQKQSAAKLGSNNPNFGTYWVYNELLQRSTRISKMKPVPEGWAKGRKIYKGVSK